MKHIVQSSNDDFGYVPSPWLLLYTEWNLNVKIMYCNTYAHILYKSDTITAGTVTGTVVYE